MNESDLSAWAMTHGRAFPQWEDFAMRLLRGNDHSRLHAWLAPLRSITLDDAKAVTVAMAAGRVNPIRQFEYESTPGLVLDAARRLAQDATRELEQEQRRAEDRKRTNAVGKPVVELGQLRGLAFRYARAVESNDAAECKRILDEVPPDAREASYRCVRCRDTGLLAVYHWRTVDAVMDARHDQAKPPAEMAVACGCLRKPKLPAYDEKRHCRSDGGWSRLVAWCDEQRRVENHPNYRSEFEEWSR
jgi:hypothetical protein